MTHSSNNINPPCKVVIFVENHNEIHPVKDIISLLPFFKNHGFKSFGFEYHENKREELLRNLESFSKIANLTKKLEEDNSLLTNGKFKFSLLNALEENGIQSQLIDTDQYSFKDDNGRGGLLLGLEASHKRELFMASRISELCTTGHVLALVGSNHYQGIRENLKYIDVKGYATPNHQISPYNLKADIFYRSLRSTEKTVVVNEEEQMLLIDIYRNKSLINIIPELIQQDYIEHLSGKLFRKIMKQRMNSEWILNAIQQQDNTMPISLYYM